MNNAKKTVSLLVPEEVSSPNFIDVYVSPTLANIDKVIYECYEQSKILGERWNRALKAYQEAISDEETEQNKLKNQNALENAAYQLKLEKALNAEPSIFADTIIQFQQKTANGYNPSPDEYRFIATLKDKLKSHVSIPSEIHKEGNRNRTTENIRRPKKENLEVVRQPFHAPVFESETNQRFYNKTAGHYFGDHHNPSFKIEHEKELERIERDRQSIINKARPFNYFAELGVKDLDISKLFAGIAVTFDFSIYFAFGIYVLQWGMLEAASLAVVPILIGKLAGPLLYKGELFASMKKGEVFNPSYKKYIIALCLALSFGVGFSFYSSKKMEEDRLEKWTIVMERMDAADNDIAALDSSFGEGDIVGKDMGITESTEVKDSPILKFLHELSTFLSMALLGILSFLAAGFFFSRLEIIARIVGLKMVLDESEDAYRAGNAHLSRLINGRKEGVRLAACIAGKRALLRVKTNKNNDL